LNGSLTKELKQTDRAITKRVTAHLKALSSHNLINVRASSRYGEKVVLISIPNICQTNEFKRLMKSDKFKAHVNNIIGILGKAKLPKVGISETPKNGNFLETPKSGHSFIEDIEKKELKMNNYDKQKSSSNYLFKFSFKVIETLDQKKEVAQNLREFFVSEGTLDDDAMEFARNWFRSGKGIPNYKKGVLVFLENQIDMMKSKRKKVAPKKESKDLQICEAKFKAKFNLLFDDREKNIVAKGLREGMTVKKFIYHIQHFSNYNKFVVKKIVDDASGKTSSNNDGLIPLYNEDGSKRGYKMASSKKTKRV